VGAIGDLTSLPGRASEIRCHSDPSEDSHRRDTDIGPSCDLVRVMRMVENDPPTYPLASHRATCVALTDNAAATSSGLVLRPSLICVGTGSGHPALLLQRRVFPGRKRSYGEVHDGGRRGFRRGVRRELELCVKTHRSHGHSSSAPLTHKRDIRASVSSSWSILPK